MTWLGGLGPGGPPGFPKMDHKSAPSISGRVEIPTAMGLIQPPNSSCGPSRRVGGPLVIQPPPNRLPTSLYHEQHKGHGSAVAFCLDPFDTDVVSHLRRAQIVSVYGFSG